MNDAGFFDRPDVAPGRAAYQFPQLPRLRVSAHDEGAPVCPWCEGLLTDVSVSLELVIAAFHTGTLDGRANARRDNDTADEDAVTVDCPHCHRPSVLQLEPIVQSKPDDDGIEWADEFEGGFNKLLPVRTDKDAEYLSGRLT